MIMLKNTLMLLVSNSKGTKLIQLLKNVALQAKIDDNNRSLFIIGYKHRYNIQYLYVVLCRLVLFMLHFMYTPKQYVEFIESLNYFA